MNRTLQILKCLELLASIATSAVTIYIAVHFASKFWEVMK